MIVGNADNDLLNTAPCGFLIFSDEGVILSVNDTLLTLLGYERDFLIGRKLELILTVANRIFYQTHLFPLLKLHNKAEEIFIAVLSSSKEEIPVLLNAARKMYNGLLCNHCILVPVQQRKKYENELLLAKKAAEEELLKNDRLLEAHHSLEVNKQDLDRQVSRLTQLNSELRQVSKVISHDMQEPIRKISIFAGIALKEADDLKNAPLITILEKIMASCERMRKMVNSLEQFLSIDAEKVIFEKVNLDHVVEIARKMAVKSTSFTGQLIIRHTRLPEISALRNQMEILFFNLIENAVKFRKPGDRVTIDINHAIIQENSYKSLPDNYRYHDVVKLLFTDGGQGFDTGHSSNLFQLFQKLEADTIGVGLGLALCKKITDNHFGEISLHSEPGKGTTVTILLPILH